MKKVLLYILATLGVGIGGFLGTPLFAFADHSNAHNETISANRTLAPGMYTWGDLTINSGVIVTLQGNCLTNTGVTINATSITVNGAISANGQGCAGGISGSAEGKTPSGQTGGGSSGNSARGAGGGGYGGSGGNGQNFSGSGPGSGLGGSAYGAASTTQPVFLGSGGGYGSNTGTGGAGGGAIKLVVLDSLLVNGTISANGNSGNSGGGGNAGGGGGSGGSIWIAAGLLNGTGSITANGGAGGGGPTRGGGGGGGRIAVYYFGEATFPQANITVLGGAAGGGGAAPGTAGPAPTFVTYGNVNGFAWSENIGWISFSCYNDFDSSAPGTNHTCDSAVYGVSATSTGAVSGYAWSSNVGWIQLNPAGPYPAGAQSWSSCLDLVGAGQSPCDSVGNNTISGWAQAVAFGGGWDGWIRMRDASWSPGVSVNPVTKELSGWAWGSDVVGWISFNSKDCDADDNGLSDGVPAECPPSGTPIPSYEVIVDLPFGTPPKAQDLVVVQGNYCPASSPPIVLDWIFVDPDTGAFQSAYQVQIKAGSGDFTSPTFDTGKLLSASTMYAPPGLAYNTTYYWRVMVWDDVDTASPWTYPLSPSGGAPPTLPAAATPFTTALHPYPKTGNFDWTPKPPAAGEVVQFSDGNPFVPAAISRIWKWDFEYDGSPPPSWDSTESAPAHTYPGNLTYNVIFEACDDAGCCSSTKAIPVSIPFPGWIEISPF